MQRIVILDCTLRDGGYVNDWKFDTQTALSIIDGLYKAGIRWIEIGILGTNSEPGKQTKFSNFEQMKPVLANRKQDCHYAVMVTTTSADHFDYPPCTEETPDIIRIAYFKPELAKTLDLARKLKALGYNVFLQAMATFMYTREELSVMLKQINELQPAAFYMVDSFSTMYPPDVAKMRDTIFAELQSNIACGFHAHNNMQLAFSNTQEFMNTLEKRQLLVDASIYGMGRGAGNVPLELLMVYMNKHLTANYNVSAVLLTYQNYLEPIYKEYGWGYSLTYYLTAINSLNSVWGWFFMNKGIRDITQLEDAFRRIPAGFTHTLNRKIGEEIVEEVRNISL